MYNKRFITLICQGVGKCDAPGGNETGHPYKTETVARGCVKHDPPTEKPRWYNETL